MPLQRALPLNETVAFKPLKNGGDHLLPQVAMHTDTVASAGIGNPTLKQISPMRGNFTQILPLSYFADTQALICRAVVVEST